MLHTTTPTPPSQTATDDLDLDLDAVDSVALRRLIEEVRNSGGPGTADGTAYNRTYHRHNR
jgi:hypothetical protein